MKDRIFNFIGLIIGSLVALGIIGLPVSAIVAIWTQNQIAINSTLTCAIIFGFYYLVIDKQK